MFISDNPAFDFQWINHGFWHALVVRVTPHYHDPVNYAMGNVEAFETFQRLHREGRLR